MTKGELVKLLGVEEIDYAVPQPWADKFEKDTGINPCTELGAVWYYGEGNLFGRPLFLYLEALKSGKLIFKKRVMDIIASFKSGDFSVDDLERCINNL